MKAFLTLMGMVYLLITLFMLIFAIQFDIMYMSRVNMGFWEMKWNVIQYTVEKVAPYLGISIILFGLSHRVNGKR